ncbi:ssDNA-binding transcriptional regulator [Xylariaceae sp. FL0255]|nr:ssDNA-binding transcriptional regulator [Xylariaceae sp. FL0255]
MPKGKMAPKRAHSSDDEDEVDVRPTKKNSIPKIEGKDDEGNSFWKITEARRVVIQDFKGKTFVNIREFYTDASGAMRPGKKGIMLTLEQYNALVKVIPAVNAELSSKGHEVADLGSASTETPAPSKPSDEKKQKKPKKKMNIEATSDEDEHEDGED